MNLFFTISFFIPFRVVLVECRFFGDNLFRNPFYNFQQETARGRPGESCQSVPKEESCTFKERCTKPTPRKLGRGYKERGKNRDCIKHLFCAGQREGAFPGKWIRRRSLSHSESETSKINVFVPADTKRRLDKLKFLKGIQQSEILPLILIDGVDQKYEDAFKKKAP